MVGVAVALPYIKIGISKQSRGIVRSAIEDVDLIVLSQGEVEYIDIINNQNVVKGQKILALKPAIVHAQIETKTNLLQELCTQQDDVIQLLFNKFDVNQLSSSLFQNELRAYLTKEKELKTKNVQLNREYITAKKSFEEGVLSKIAYEKSRYDYITSKNELSSFYERQKLDWQSRNVQVKEQIENLEGDLNRLEAEMKGYTLYAPISGTIIKYTGIKTGSYLNANQPIATISPDRDFIVECSVSPEDIGFITKGQAVNLQVDAFNYNQWGLGKAEVVEIDKNITITEQQVFFKVRCKLLKTAFELKNGYQAQIKKGMTLTARFTVIERSLWDLLFDKVDDWFNPRIIPKS